MYLVKTRFLVKTRQPIKTSCLVKTRQPCLNKIIFLMGYTCYTKWPCLNKIYINFIPLLGYGVALWWQYSTKDLSFSICNQFQSSWLFRQFSLWPPIGRKLAARYVNILHLSTGLNLQKLDNILLGGVLPIHLILGFLKQKGGSCGELEGKLGGEIVRDLRGELVDILWHI